MSTCPHNPLGLVGVDNMSSVLWFDRLKDNRLGIAWALGLIEPSKFSQNLERAPDVINMSFGSRGLTVAQQRFLQFQYLLLSQGARDKGTILVAATGNAKQNADMGFPHSLNGVIAVGATTKDGISGDFSNWGHTVDVMAPGVDVPVVGKAAGGIHLVDGTSFASPIVAGIVSHMKSVYAELNWKTAIYFLQSTSVPMDCNAYCVGRADCYRDCCKNGVQVCTPGRANAGAAVLAAKNAARDGLPRVALVDADQFAIPLVHVGMECSGVKLHTETSVAYMGATISRATIPVSAYLPQWSILTKRAVSMKAKKLPSRPMSLIQVW